ncbi:hypothetical protein B0H13DRAFT_2361230 [Mycena leptocephala]|nr:hypothetical protein B0H13DRAFT_2361230 [Mycena leptocephala]
MSPRRRRPGNLRPSENPEGDNPAVILDPFVAAMTGRYSGIILGPPLTIREDFRLPRRQEAPTRRRPQVNLDMQTLGRNDFDAVRARIMALEGAPTAAEEMRIRESNRRRHREERDRILFREYRNRVPPPYVRPPGGTHIRRRLANNPVRSASQPPPHSQHADNTGDSPLSVDDVATASAVNSEAIFLNLEV